MNIAASGRAASGSPVRGDGHPELTTHPDYATGRVRSKNRDALHDELERTW
jgi:crotonobetainyl-CoA:carnitine CoA-transferase CaiB-like acyl-CoA transferase